jgi:hypothetical protein
MPLFTLSALLLFGSSVQSQGSWNRRVYFDQLGCKGNMGYGVQVYYPVISCPGGISSTVINSPCENKSQNTLTLSSEGTSCQSTNPSTVSDDIYFPAADQAGKAATYLTVNSYSGQTTCSMNKGQVILTQETFAADGKCYAIEPDQFFKASCNGSNGRVVFCKDPKCEDCSLGSQSYDGTCQLNAATDPKQGICSGVGTNFVVAPTSPKLGTSSVSATKSSASATNTSTPAKNSGDNFDLGGFVTFFLALAGLAVM